MRTVSVQQMPNGFEIEVPTFGEWVKAGVGFSIGMCIVGAFALAFWAAIGWKIFVNLSLRSLF